MYIIIILVAQIIFNTYFSIEVFIYENKSELLSLFEKIKNSYSDDSVLIGVIVLGIGIIIIFIVAKQIS